jgi:predicted esterase
VVDGYSSEHSRAMTSEALIRAFYGRDANHQYFDGFSDGGHQAFDVGSQDYRLVDAVAAPDDPALSTARV